MQVHYFEHKEEAVKHAAAALTVALQQPGPILLLLSSGSALQLLNHVNAASLSMRITIGMLDERYSTDPNVNNFSQMFETAFARVAEQRAVHFIDSRVVEGETLEDYARRLETAWKQWASQNPTGKIITTLGMGPDGHTAGIMPFEENKALFKRLFEDVKMWITGYDAVDKHEYPLRATATLPFLQTEVDTAILFVTGENKLAALQRVMDDNGSYAQTPARVWRDMRTAQLFTDIKL